MELSEYERMKLRYLICNLKAGGAKDKSVLPCVEILEDVLHRYEMRLLKGELIE